MDSYKAHDELALLELLDRILDKGVVIHGDLILSVANVDLVYVGLRMLICSTEKMQELMPHNASMLSPSEK